MGRPGVTYEQTAAVCDDLLKNAQKITLRDIMARTGGSPTILANIGIHGRQRRKVSL